MKHYTMKTLQKMLGDRGRTSIYRDIKAGRLPKPTKIGGMNYFRDDQVQASLEQLRSQTKLAK